MTATPSRQDIARQFLRISAERVEEANYGRRHCIYLARDYELPWADIAHDLGLSEKTCRSYYEQYIEERRGAAA